MSITLSQRQALLVALPCFSMLNPEESQELASMMFEACYEQGKTIVAEEELVHCVFIIVSGQAEVTHAVTLKNHTTHVPVSLMGPGEAIGLNDTGFFSMSGKRTATVTAISDMVVLGLTLENLHQFFSQHPDLLSSMHGMTTTMLRMKLIKQSLPFVHLSHERTQWLVNQIEDISVKAGTILFHQGEEGDRCYLIQSGQIEIIAMNPDQSEHCLAVLKSPALFGEATLITHGLRNATARVIEDSELLVLQHKHLSELIESEHRVATMVMTLMVDRSRPIQNGCISLHQRETADKHKITILKNPENGNYFQLSEEGLFIWQQLNGKQTLQEITLAMANERDIFAPNMVAALISKLAKNGFVKNVEINKNLSQMDQPAWVRVMLKVRRIIESRVAIGDADKWLTTVYDKFAYLFFTRLGKVVMAMLAITGLFAFLLTTEETIATFKVMPNVWMLLVCLLPATLVSVILHELGHAFAVKSCGREVHYMGVGWYWLGPVAFVDTSDMWLSESRPRTMVNLAGVYTDVFVAGVCALCILFISNPYIQAFLWLFALFTYMNAFRMLNPLQELDGYYVLMDLLDRPRLRQSAVAWLVKQFPQAIKQPRLFRHHKAEVGYWLACILFIVLVSLLTLFVQTFIFKIIGIQSNPYVSLILPIMVAILSSLGIVADVRSQTDD